MTSSCPTAVAFLPPVLVSIPAGWFSMGCECGRDDEKPVHRVWVDAFQMAAYQVSNAEYACFLGQTRRPPPPVTWGHAHFHHPQQPVVSVSWFDARAYCHWLSCLTACHYTLPTEAQWERAARGHADAELYPWGNTAPELLPHYARRWQNGPEAVGLYAPNAFGLYNLGDNVHEWCCDWYDPGYYARSPERNPSGPANGARKASRGGSWRHHIKVTRTAARSSIPPEFKYADYGFRLVCVSASSANSEVPAQLGQ
jgi:formylglycine-generating enzyme